ncbi:MAG: hypothetical protein AAGB93_16055 [Planctomycetota bacterium]
METLTYPAIEPLVADPSVRGNAVDVTFRCERTGVEVAATGKLRKLDSFSDQAARTVKKNLWSGLRRSATRAVADTLGKGTAGKIARELTSTGLKQAEKNTAFSRGEVEAGVVAAFETVRRLFRFDEEHGAWVGDPAALSTTVERPPRR